MPAEFVTLADVLRPHGARAGSEVPPPAATIDRDVASDTARPVSCVTCASREARCDSASGDVARDVRVFRATLTDALAGATAKLLRELASDVLARELASAPCGLDALVVRLASEYVLAGPLRVRISPQDRIDACDLPVIVDPALRSGDVMLECTSGFVDARLGVRLGDLLDRASDRT